MIRLDVGISLHSCIALVVFVCVCMCVCVSMLEDKHQFKFGGVISGFHIHLEAFVLTKIDEMASSF